nr:unnamed protein product [Callosobruchus chinensis]
MIDEELKDITSEQAQVLLSLTQPMETLTALIVESAPLVSKPKELALQKPKMQQAVLALKEKTEAVTQIVKQVQSLKTLQTPLVVLNAALGNIDESCGEKAPRNDVCALDNIIQPLITLGEQVTELRSQIETTPIPIQGVLSVIMAETPLVELASAVQSLDRVDEIVADITPEQSEIISSLIVPMQKLSAVMVEAKSLLDKPEQLQLQKNNVKQAILLLKSQVEETGKIAEQAQSLKILELPIQALTAALGRIEESCTEEVPRKDKQALQELIQPILLLTQEVKTLESKIDQAPQPVQGVQSVIEIITPLAELTSAIQNMEDIAETLADITPEQSEILQSLKEPIQKLTMLTVDTTSLLSKPNEMKMQIAEMQKAVIAMKSQAERISEVVSQAQSLKVLDQPMQALTAALGHIGESCAEEVLRKDKQALQELIQPVSLLTQEVKTLQSKIDQTPQPIQGVLSVIDIVMPLAELKSAIESIENAAETAADITPEQSELLQSLKEPMQKLAAAVIQTSTVTDNTKELEAKKPIMKQAVTALKAQAEVVCQNISKAEALKILELPLNKLSAILNTVEEASSDKLSRHDKKALQELAQPTLQLIQQVQTLQACIKSAPIPLQGVLSVIEIAPLLTELVSAIQNVDGIITEATSDISPMEYQTVTSLKEPLQKLETVVTDIIQAIDKPAELEFQRPKMIQAISDLKQQIETASPAVSKMETLKTSKAC